MSHSPPTGSFKRKGGVWSKGFHVVPNAPVCKDVGSAMDWLESLGVATVQRAVSLCAAGLDCGPPTGGKGASRKLQSLVAAWTSEGRTLDDLCAEVFGFLDAQDGQERAKRPRSPEQDKDAKDAPVPKRQRPCEDLDQEKQQQPRRGTRNTLDRRRRAAPEAPQNTLPQATIVAPPVHAPAPAPAPRPAGLVRRLPLRGDSVLLYRGCKCCRLDVYEVRRVVDENEVVAVSRTSYTPVERELHRVAGSAVWKPRDFAGAADSFGVMHLEAPDKAVMARVRSILAECIRPAQKQACWLPSLTTCWASSRPYLAPHARDLLRMRKDFSDVDRCHSCSERLSFL